MKNIITVAALLVAGTAFANAEIVLTTEFRNANQSNATSVELTNTWASGLDEDLLGTVSGSVASLTNSAGGSVSLQTSDTAGQDATFFSPNLNLGTDTNKPWTAQFTYTQATGLKSIDSIDLGYAMFNSGGAWQTAGASWSGITVVATVAVGSVSKDFTGSLGTFNGNGGGSRTLTLSGEAIDLGSSGSFTVTLKPGTLATGGFLGLYSIAYSGSVVPEPSAFGLLAGAGALALVAARRRRRRA